MTHAITAGGRIVPAVRLDGLDQYLVQTLRGRARKLGRDQAWGLVALALFEEQPLRVTETTGPGGERVVTFALKQRPGRST
jgi:hypothetical protein